MNEQGTDLAGEVVTWDQQSSVTYQEVTSALAAAKLPIDVAKDLRPTAAFSRACKHMKENRTIDKLSKAKGGTLAFQFTKKYLDQNRLEFDYECKVELNTKTGVITCPENRGLEATARSLFAHARQMRTAQDVTRLVQKLFKEHADLFSVNPRKGVAYFVPERHRDFTEKVDIFLHHLGGTLWRFPVPVGTVQGNLSIRDSMQRGFQALVGELDAIVSNWDDEVKKSTLDKMIEKYDVAQFKVESYIDYLQTEGVQQLVEKVQKSKQAMLDKVLELSKEETAV